MKNLLRILTLTAAVVMFAKTCSMATIWRVNNKGFAAQFTSLLAANNSNLVLPGDTIHLEGSPDYYVATTLTKRLVVIGTGYFLAENPATSANVLPATINSVGLDKGAEGSQLIGLYIIGEFGISVGVSNITIKRCWMSSNIDVYAGTADIRIIQNFFANTIASRSTASALNPLGRGFPANLIFNNNICQRPLVIDDGYSITECKNNVFDCVAIANQPSIKMNAGSFQNNILKNPNASVSINGGSNLNVSYNIGSSPNQFGTANNNIVVTDFAALFIDPATNTTDGDYQLRPGSAGSNNGSDGTDRGAFGGAALTNRYKLSGLASIPVVYEINTSGVAGPSGLTVTIKARTIN